MDHHEAASWHCVNTNCNAPAAARSAKSGGSEDKTPRCVCGWAMKKSYRSPVFRYLDFLRPRATVETEAAAETAER